MKVMAGFDNRHKTDYRAKAAEEVAKVQQKAKILEEMLQSHKPGEGIAEGDVFEVGVQHGSLGAGSDCFRNLQMRFKAPTPRFRRCARRNPTTPRLSASCWKSMTAYTEPLSGTS